MIITKKEIIKAVNDSIKHWNKDIIKPLEAGKKIGLPSCGFWPFLEWKHNGMEVKAYAEYCPLCEIVDENCDCCPLICCDEDSPWAKFHDKPTLTNARKMVKSLQKIDITKIEDVEIS